MPNTGQERPRLRVQVACRARRHLVPRQPAALPSFLEAGFDALVDLRLVAIHVRQELEHEACVRTVVRRSPDAGGGHLVVGLASHGIPPSTILPQTRHSMRWHRPAGSFIPAISPQQSMPRRLKSTSCAGRARRLSARPSSNRRRPSKSSFRVVSISYTYPLGPFVELETARLDARRNDLRIAASVLVTVGQPSLALWRCLRPAP